MLLSLHFRLMEKADDFLDAGQQSRIVAAIEEAERETSGEIRIYIEKECPEEDALERAKIVFNRLGLENTRERNAVLFYLAYDDHKFAVLGDKGIYERTSQNFWDSTKDLLASHFRNGQFAEGFCFGVREAGIQLKRYFPFRPDDVNELPNDIVFG